MRNPWIIWLTLAMSLPVAGLWAAEVYTWTDAQGLTHLTDRPPPPGAKVKAVAKDRLPIVEKLPPETAVTGAEAAARAQIKETHAAMQTVQALSERLSAAQSAYEEAVAALQEERAKFDYSAKKRKAPRQSVTELEQKAKAAFDAYRQELDAYNAAALAAREAELRAQSAIEAVGAERNPPPPQAPAPEPPGPDPAIAD